MIKPTLDKTFFFIISGPSGAGEDAVIRGLGKKIRLKRVVTTVTRKKRIGEREGQPYYFVSVPKFKKMIRERAFIEWAKVYGDYRGSTKKEIDRLSGKKVLALWKIDFQGVWAIKKQMPEVPAVFIYTPSLEVLERRLIKRGLDSPAVIKNRRFFTKKWLTKKKIYDYTVVNREGRLDKAVGDVFSILKKCLSRV